MNSYIDMHAHILPGLDDGAKNSAMALKMLRQAQAEGIREIILTPHYKPMRHNARPETVKRALYRLEELKDAAKISIRLHLGNEIYYGSDVIEAFREEMVFTMAGSSCVLVEFGPAEDYAYIRKAAYRLLAEGYVPVLAHVERYRCLMEKKVRAEELYDMGCHLQVNASSITGENGMTCRQNVKWLLKREYISFVGTDCHDDRRRMPEMAKAAAYVAKKYGEAYCREIFRDNAAALIQGNYG